MKLSQKIKHIKRHKQNKRFAKMADNVHFAAANSILNGNGNVFIVSPRLYNVMNVRRGCVPKNIKNTRLVSDTCIITVPTEVINTHDKLDYVKEWCDIPKGVDIPFTPGSERIVYLHVDKPIAPDICTLNGVRV